MRAAIARTRSTTESGSTPSARARLASAAFSSRRIAWSGIGEATARAFAAAGARIVEGAERVWAESELLLKVKEPIAPEHERLNGDATLFTRADEVEEAWSIVDPLLTTWSEMPAPDFPNYAAGSWGPDAADALMTRGIYP